MRFKFWILSSTAISLAGAMPLWAQTTVPTPQQPTPAPLPPAETTPSDAPADDPATAQDESEEIVVTGIRRSLESAQTIKRESEAILDSIVAEDIGKLPDITASASLARVPGVQVTRAAGEAANVQIRGLPDISTTYNGREIFTAENRFVAIQDFPAGQVAALEVYKSSTANLIEGGIGGQVNVRGRRPFDFDGFTLFGALNGVHLEQSQNLMLNTNLLISNRFDTGIGEIGILLSGAYAETEFLDSSREAAQFIEFGVPVAGATGTFRRANSDSNPAVNERTRPDVIRFPDSTAIFYGRSNFKRPSVSGAIQWKPSDDLEIYADGLFQGFRGAGQNRFLLSPLFGGTSFTNVVLQPGTNQVRSLTASNQVRPEGFQSAERATTDTYQIAGGFIWTPERLRLSGDIAYTDSTFKTNINNIDYAFTRAPVVDVNFDIPTDNGGPSFSFRDFDVTDSANYIFRGLFDRNFVSKGDDIQARLDAEYETGFDFLTRINLGVRYSDRSASTRNGQRFINVEGRRLPLSSLPGIELTTTEPGFRFDDGIALRRFVVPTRESIRANIDALRTLVGFPTGVPPITDTESFDAGEKAYTGYGQLRYEFNLGGMTIDGLVGLRAVRTETTVEGTNREVVNDVPTFIPVSQTQKFTDYLPNASARLRLTDELQLRAAFTETRTRPNFVQLNPSLIIDPAGGDGFRGARGGNPDLRPLQSNNYDLSLEYYFSRTGSATVALFRRDVNGFIADVVTETTDPVLGPIRFFRPENGGDGRLQGVEATFTTFLDFDFVPEWAKGFGIQANYTYNDATSELPAGDPPQPGDLGVTLPGQQRFSGVSKHSYNLVALYEKPFFSARLAYNYRSDFITFYRNPPNNPIVNGGSCCIEFDRPEILEGRGVLDFAMTVTPTPAVTIAFDVGNVLGNPIKLTNPYTADPNGPSFPLRRTYLERLYSLGVRFRF